MTVPSLDVTASNRYFYFAMYECYQIPRNLETDWNTDSKKFGGKKGVVALNIHIIRLLAWSFPLWKFESYHIYLPFTFLHPWEWGWPASAVWRHAIWSTDNNVSGLGLTVPIAVLISHGIWLLFLCYTKFIPLSSVYTRFEMEKGAYQNAFFQAHQFSIQDFSKFLYSSPP
jgi:hypothetical protein